MNRMFSLLRSSFVTAMAALFIAACTTVLPTPPLSVTPESVIYLKVVKAKRSVGISMPPILLAGALGGAIGEGAKSQSERFAESVDTDPRIMAMEVRLRDKVIAQCREKGLKVVDASTLKGKQLTDNEQIITLSGFNVFYFAKTIAHSYSPYAATFIESSRDPAIPKGQTRYMRQTVALVDDNKYSFKLADSILKDQNLAIEGIDQAIDDLARNVAIDLAAARKL